jgi:serine/threonine protein phosphatase PrpC
MEPLSPNGANQTTSRKSAELKRRISRVEDVLVTDLPEQKRFIRSVGEFDDPMSPEICEQQENEKPGETTVETESPGSIDVTQEANQESIESLDEATQEVLKMKNDLAPEEIEIMSQTQPIPVDDSTMEISASFPSESLGVEERVQEAGDVTPVLSPASRATPVPAAQDYVCYVCRRRLGSAEMLKKHEELSALHEKNLRILKMANQKKRTDLRNDVIRLRYLSSQTMSPLTSSELRRAEADLGETQNDLEDKWKSSIESSAVVAVGNFELKMTAASWTGNKPSNEDRMLIGFSIKDGLVKGCLVADGHCGESCADYLIANLVPSIERQMAVHPIRESLLHAFRQTDKEFMDHAIANQIPSGSTCIVSLFFEEDEDLVCVTAHVGDSRGVAMIDDNVVRLTEDHKPDRSDEKVRLSNSGGHVVDVGGVWRVFTPNVVSIGGRTLQWGLAVSRAFGDLALKSPVEIVSAEPEIGEVKLGNGSVVIQACDGIFDVLSDTETIEFGIRSGPTGILRGAYGKLSDDNLSAVVVEITRKENSSLVTGQPPQMITPSQQVVSEEAQG